MAVSFNKQSFGSYLIENVTIWTNREIVENARIYVENGRLKAFGSLAVKDLLGDRDIGDVQRIDGHRRVIMPAGVDAQAHLRVPGQSHKETPRTGLLAALKGGYAAVLTMPNTQPTVDSVEVLRRGQDEVHPFETEFGVCVFWSAAITKKLNTDDLTNYEDLVRAGVRAFTNDGLGVASDQVMEQAFAALEKLGVPLLQHAEFLGHGGSLAPGPVQEKLGASPYPDAPEWQMVERDLRELRKHPRARYHVLHVSSARTVELVREAKREGLNVTAEVSPHHLYFNTETINAENPSFKMNPPIRSPADQEALWTGLADGTIDFVATDHAPHEELMKQGTVDKMAFGTLGLETTMPVLIDGLNHKRLTPQQLVDVWASKPAHFLRLGAGLGDFVLDAPFHAVWVDVQAHPRVYTQEDISSLSKNSCFIGSKLPGRIEGAFHEQSVFVFP